MTDNKIIKALKIHTGRSDATCKECVFYGQDYCRLKIAEAALDLINRQKAEIDELKLICDKEKADRLYLSQQNKAIIAGQETLHRALSDEIAKNEELRNQDMVVFRGSRGCGKTQFVAEKIRDSINRNRAEAIKEFAEQLKTRARMPIGTLYGKMVYIKDIDNLVKEMVGDAE